MNHDAHPKAYTVPEQVRWIAVAWLILGIVSATQIVVGRRAEGMHYRWTALFFTTMAGWLAFAFAAPGVLWMHRRFPVSRGHLQNLPIHVVAAAALAVLYPLWTSSLDWAFDPLASPQPFRSSFITAMYLRFHTGIIIYAVILVVNKTIDSIRLLAQREAEAAQLEGELTKAQLEALRRQLEPRFLFDALNGIAGLARENRNDEAVAMIVGLSDLLRRVLEDSGRRLVPLCEEISFLEGYVEIQAMRFGGRLKVTMDVPHKIYSALVPSLILQPLMEHAIVCSAGTQAVGGEIHVIARESEGTVSIRFRNSGAALPRAEQAADAGAGISTTRDRLATLYGSTCRLDLCNGEAAGVEAVLTIPYKVEA